MRFISKYRRYKLAVREHVKMTLANGKENIIQNGVIAAFNEHGIIEPWEKDKAMQVFKFRGTTQERDEATPVDPSNRLSLYDTEAPAIQQAWARFENAESLPPGTIQREVEEFMLGYGRSGRDYLLVVPDPVEAPWATYDQLTIHGRRDAAMVAERNIEIALATGTPLESLIAYEKQGRSDERILAAYQAALDLGLKSEDVEELVEA